MGPTWRTYMSRTPEPTARSARPARATARSAFCSTGCRTCGYTGYLALEPRLAIAGHSSGFSGPDGMAHAVEVLRRLMQQHEVREVEA